MNQDEILEIFLRITNKPLEDKTLKTLLDTLDLDLSRTSLKPAIRAAETHPPSRLTLDSQQVRNNVSGHEPFGFEPK